MAKYHVNPKTGKASICRATVRACPLGGESMHFESKEATRAADELNDFVESKS